MKKLSLLICFMLFAVVSANADIMTWDSWDILSEDPWTSVPDTYVGPSPGTALLRYSGDGMSPIVLPTFIPNSAYNNTTLLKVISPTLNFRIPGSTNGTRVRMHILFFERYAFPKAPSHWQLTSYHWESGWARITYEWDVLAGDTSIDVILDFYERDYPTHPDSIYAPYIDRITFETISYPPQEVQVDILPDSCPNPVNLRGNGFLSVSISGSDELDVRDIDPNSVELMGLSAVRQSFGDVSSLQSGTDVCGCRNLGPDGYEDLVLEFRIGDIREAIWGVRAGEEVSLGITGSFYSGKTFQGSDCVLVQKIRKKLNKGRP